MRKGKDYTYRSMRDERQYGLFWYSGLWHVLRPILVGLAVAILVIGIGATVWNKLYGEFAAPVDEQDSGEYKFEVTSGQSLASVAKKLEGTEKCPDCGNQRADHDFFYCGDCGAAVTWKQLADNEDCPGCGKALTEQAMFCCSECGTAVRWKQAAENQKCEKCGAEPANHTQICCSGCGIPVTCPNAKCKMGLTVQFRCGSCQEQISWKQLSDYEQCPYCGKRLADTVQLCCANCGEPVTWEPQLIRSRTVFKFYCDFAGMGQKIQVGTYTLRKDMSMQEIADQLSSGDGNPMVRNITLIPGETIEDFAAKLVETGVLENSDRFLQLCREGTAFRGYENIDKVLNTVTASERKYILEGYLAPNTYEVYVGSDEETIIRKLLSQTETVFDEFRTQAAKQGMSMDQVLTLASIIEKEAKESDFARVSAVFYNRQARGMPLQSDVTIHYITGVRRMALSSGDLAINSPYNTYKVVGLPVGPICNPSPAAIRAALYPDESMMAEGYLFFCAKYPQSGELVFAKTNAEHEENVRAYKKYWEEYDRSRGIGE